MFLYQFEHHPFVLIFEIINISVALHIPAKFPFCLFPTDIQWQDYSAFLWMDLKCPEESWNVEAEKCPAGCWSTPHYSERFCLTGNSADSSPDWNRKPCFVCLFDSMVTYLNTNTAPACSENKNLSVKCPAVSFTFILFRVLIGRWWFSLFMVRWVSWSWRKYLMCFYRIHMDLKSSIQH